MAWRRLGRRADDALGRAAAASAACHQSVAPGNADARAERAGCRRAVSGFGDADPPGSTAPVPAAGDRDERDAASHSTGEPAAERCAWDRATDRRPGQRCATGAASGRPLQWLSAGRSAHQPRRTGGSRTAGPPERASRTAERASAIAARTGAGAALRSSRSRGAANGAARCRRPASGTGRGSTPRHSSAGGTCGRRCSGTDQCAPGGCTRDPTGSVDRAGARR